MVGGAGLLGLAGAALLSGRGKRAGRRPAGLLSGKNTGKLAMLAAFGALMYLRGRIIPKYADDYPYSFKWDPRYGNLTEADRKYERVKDLKDLVGSQIAHYRTWDGRVLADFFVQLNLIKDDKKTFDVVNTLVMLAQLFVCGSLARGRVAGLKSLSEKEVLLLTAGFWFCTPHLVATCLWLTGSVTYLWTGLMESLYVLPYALHYHDPDFSIPAPLAALLGLGAGWSMETGAGAALMLTSMELVRSLLKSKSAPWLLWGVLGAGAGMLLLLAAPGNRLKFRLEREMSDTLPESMNERLPGYVPEEYTYTPTMFKLWFMEGFLPTIIRELPLQLPVLLYFLNRDNRSEEATKFILAMESAVFAIPAVMMLSPEYPKRSTYHSVLYLLPAAIKAMEHISIPPAAEWSEKAALAGKLAALAMGVNVLSSLIIDADLHCQHRDQVDTLMKNREKEVITVDNAAVPWLYSFLAGDRAVTWDVAMGLGFENRKDPYNEAAAAYYGVNSIESRSYDSHRYYSKKREDILFSIINPLRCFLRVIREFLKGEDRPSSCKREL